MKSLSKFPNILYVTIEPDSEESTFLAPHTTVEEVAEAGQSIKVGVYRLDRVSVVSAKVVLT